MKIVNLLLSVLFLVFAFLQINDPDPAVWILIYGVMAVMCVLVAFGYYYSKVLIVILVVYVAYSVTYLPSILRWLKADNKSMLFDDIAKMQNLYIEESREFLGLMICVTVLVVHLVRAHIVRRPI
ncbi:MAG: transmembrane 220 family protein [Cyclobacteriaceae bacterium]